MKLPPFVMDARVLTTVRDLLILQWAKNVWTMDVQCEIVDTVERICLVLGTVAGGRILIVNSMPKRSVGKRSYPKFRVVLAEQTLFAARQNAKIINNVHLSFHVGVPTI